MEDLATKPNTYAPFSANVAKLTSFNIPVGFIIMISTSA